MTTKKTQKLDRYQRRYLQDQLRYSRYDGSFKEPKEPPAVRQARKIVQGWDSHISRMKGAYDSRRARAHSEAVKMLNFGTPEQALAAVEAYKAQFHD